MKPLIIQAHLNENASNKDNPNVPITPEACAAAGTESARAGASVVHFHARDKEGRQAPFDTEFYQVAGRALRESSDALWWPPQGFADTPQKRWRHVDALAQDASAGLELISIDPGSGDMLIYDPGSKSIHRGDITSELRDPDAAGGAAQVRDLEHWLWFSQRVRELKIRPIFGVLEPGYLRRVLALADAGLVDTPLLLHFFLTDRFSFGLPATSASLEILQSMIPESVPYEWFVSPMGCLEATERSLEEYAIASGGHVRVGLGCPPLDGWPGGERKTNAQLVAEAAERAAAVGRPVATPVETRRILGVTTA